MLLFFARSVPIRYLIFGAQLNNRFAKIEFCVDVSHRGLFSFTLFGRRLSWSLVFLFQPTVFSWFIFLFCFFVRPSICSYVSLCDIRCVYDVGEERSNNVDDKDSNNNNTTNQQTTKTKNQVIRLNFFSCGFFLLALFLTSYTSCVCVARTEVTLPCSLTTQHIKCH